MPFLCSGIVNYLQYYQVKGFRSDFFFQIISTSPYLSPSHLAVGCVPDNEVRILLLLSLAWHQFARGGLSPV